MEIITNIWFVTSLMIIFIILANDPKASLNNFGSSQIGSVFNSKSDGQKAIRRFTWVLIVSFYMLTFTINYISLS
jgi:protein translocase SecG subunit